MRGIDLLHSGDASPHSFGKFVFGQLTDYFYLPHEAPRENSKKEENTQKERCLIDLNEPKIDLNEPKAKLH